MFVRTLSKSIFLLTSLVIITCVIYPLALWFVGQTLFPFQANGSIIYDSKNKPVGSKLIAQPFTKDEYFQPRPSAASYDASASTSSALAASNYALRDRVARMIGPIAKYQNGQSVAPDILKWYRQDKFQGKPHIVLQWEALHKKKLPTFTNNDVPAIFFEMWQQDHPDVQLQDIPGDFVTTSASGLDPDISLQNAEYQLDRVAAKWASTLKRNPDDVRKEIEQILQENTASPFGGLAGEKFVNVLEVNLELNKHYGSSS